jgi:hypothetical protein
MVDSVADWPLHRVVEYLRKKEKDDKGDVELDCRLYYTSGIRMFGSIVDELAHEYDVSKGRMCRWLSYHGAVIAKEDILLGNLSGLCDKTRQLALTSNSGAVASIQDGLTPYAPVEEDGRRVSFFVYNSWVLSDFNGLAQVCGVAPSQVAQVYMLRSVLTCDLPILQGVLIRIQKESDWWGKWMRYRLSALEMAISLWESS